MNKHLIVICGPTATGKTEVSLQLAKYFNTGILSADSRQFYKELTIGTAKPDHLTLSKFTHYLINNKSINEEYNVSLFEKESLNILDTIYKNKNIVILCGGSGLYINALCHGMDSMPESDSKIRSQLLENYRNNGLNFFSEELKKRDMVTYQSIDLKNPQRVMRALEVCIKTGKSYSSFKTGRFEKRNFTTIKIGLNLDRKMLYERINQRVDKMIKDGLIDEVSNLYQFKALNALQTVGYKEIFDYIENKYSLDEAVELIKKNTRNYAKRQITWFKKDKEINWFSPDEYDRILQFLIQHLPHTPEF